MLGGVVSCGGGGRERSGRCSTVQAAGQPGGRAGAFLLPGPQFPTEVTSATPSYTCRQECRPSAVAVSPGAYGNHVRGGPACGAVLRQCSRRWLLSTVPYTPAPCRYPRRWAH